jgi:single-strand DNA-binding protein
MKVSGTVYAIGEQKSLGANGFTKRELIVETTDNPKYPQLVAFEATKERCALLDAVKVGDAVDVEFNLRGREWRSPSGDVKYFNTLDIWKVSVTSKAPERQQPIVVSGNASPDVDPPF